MKLQTIWTIIYLLTINSLGYSLLVEELNAQTKKAERNEPNISVDNGAMYLENLKNPSTSGWNFSTNNQTENARDYQLSIAESEVILTEQKPPEWRNTGDDPNYSVLVDIYDFSEETAE